MSKNSGGAGEQHRVHAVSRPGGSLVVAMVDSVDRVAVDVHTGLKVEPVITTEAALVEAITKYYG